MRKRRAWAKKGQPVPGAGQAKPAETERQGESENSSKQARRPSQRPGQGARPGLFVGWWAWVVGACRGGDPLRFARATGKATDRAEAQVP